MGQPPDGSRTPGGACEARTRLTAARHPGGKASGRGWGQPGEGAITPSGWEEGAPLRGTLCPNQGWCPAVQGHGNPSPFPGALPATAL